uniref:Secreted protein n=1 Tax=Rhipicephalus appendiculatus TaxID=34631 RepID=A0A131YFE7_RHIAP
MSKVTCFSTILVVAAFAFLLSLTEKRTPPIALAFPSPGSHISVIASPKKKQYDVRNAGGRPSPPQRYIPRNNQGIPRHPFNRQPALRNPRPQQVFHGAFGA